MNKILLAAAPINGRARPKCEQPPVGDPRATSPSDHFVQFYDDDAFLVASVARFAREGIDRDSDTILIATPDHTRGIMERLRTGGVDVAALQAAGRLRCLDAAETLDLFMVDGMPDAARFQSVIGGQVARVGASNRPLRMFGEMVALLWMDGKPGAALRLEELWNELGQRHTFSLFCAYPLGCFAGDANGNGFRHVCGAHARVLPTESFSTPGQTMDERLREIARLQQKAAALDNEIGERQRVESELRRAQEEGREAEIRSRRLAAIVESSDDAIISKTLNGTITSWNHSAERIFGYTAEEAIGRNITMLIPTELLSEEPFIVSQVSQGKRINHYDTVRQRKDGSRVEISLTVSPIRDARGQIIGISKIARDITERRRVEKALQSAREELGQANTELERRVRERTAALAEAVAQMEEFSYTVSHDLRAPLRGMQVYSQALLEDYGPTLDDEARRCLERIADNATRLDKMVLDVLTFSRVSRSEIRLERVSLDQLVRGLVQHYPEMHPALAEITIEPLADVFGHEPSLTQAVSNLLTNAVKFVAPGVRPKVRVWTQNQGRNVRLWVRDNGIGVDPRYQHRLFRMFERVHPGLPYDGTGVGLAIVRKALSRMGGDAGMESDGTNGSSFWIQLPEPPSNTQIP